MLREYEVTSVILESMGGYVKANLSVDGEYGKTINELLSSPGGL